MDILYYKTGGHVEPSKHFCNILEYKIKVKICTEPYISRNVAGSLLCLLRPIQQIRKGIRAVASIEND